jgi:hypothetical protein
MAGQVEASGGHVFKTVGEAHRAEFGDPVAALRRRWPSNGLSAVAGGISTGSRPRARSMAMTAWTAARSAEDRSRALSVTSLAAVPCHVASSPAGTFFARHFGSYSRLQSAFTSGRPALGLSAGGGGQCGGDVGVAEVVSLEQQCFSGGPGQGVREAVPEVQAGLVAAAPAEITVGVAGDAGLVVVTGSMCSSAVCTSSSRRRLATGSRLASMRTAVSSQFAAEIRLLCALSMAWVISAASRTADRCQSLVVTTRVGQSATGSWSLPGRAPRIVREKNFAGPGRAAVLRPE